MIDGVLYFTAGDRRAVVAVNPGSGETLWTYRYEEPAARVGGLPEEQPRRGVLDRWPSVQDPHRHARLQPDRPRREDRPSRCRLRQGRRRRHDQGGREGRELRSVHRPPDEHHAADDLRQRRGHPDLDGERAQSEVDEVPEGGHDGLRRADRQEAVELPHHSAQGRVRRGHVAEQLEHLHRAHRRLGAVRGR